MGKRRAAILFMTVLAAVASIATDDAPPNRWELEDEARTETGEVSASSVAVFDVDISRAALPADLVADGTVETELCAWAVPLTRVDAEVELEVDGVVRATGRTAIRIEDAFEACFEPVGVVCVIEADCSFQVLMTVSPSEPTDMQLVLRVEQRGTREGPLPPSDATIDVKFVEWR